MSWTSLLDLKDWIDIPDGDDDSGLLLALDATNAYITLCVGRFLGPSDDTTRTYRRIEPDRAEGCRVLWVPGGLRSFDTLELRRASTDDWEEVTSGDVVLGPPSWDLRPGQAYSWLEFIDDPTGSWLAFPWHGEMRLTDAEFGPEVVDPVGAQIARTAMTRMWEAREEGSLRNPTPSKFVYEDDLIALRALGMEHAAGVS